MRGATRVLLCLISLASACSRREPAPAPAPVEAAAPSPKLAGPSSLSAIVEPDRSSSPLALANVDGRRVAVLADEDDQRLRVLALPDGKALATVQLKGTPGHVVIDKEGVAWVAIRDADVVQSFRLACAGDTCTLQEGKSVATPREPLALAIVNGKLFVACTWGRELVSIALPSGEVLAKTGLAREPRALLATKDGAGIYIAHAAGSRVSEARLVADKALPVREHRLDWRDHAYEDGMAVNDEPRQASQGFSLARTEGHVLAPMVLAYTGDPVPSSGYGSPKDDSFFPHETMMVSLADPPTPSPVRIRSRATVFGAEENRVSAGRVAWPPALAPCLLPRAAAPVPWRSSILVACMGIDQVIEIDAGEKPLLESMGARWNVPSGPVAIAIDEEQHEAWVWSLLDRGLSKIALGPSEKTVTRPADLKLGYVRDVPLDETWAKGRRIFHQPVAFDGRACASCHPDARTDGLTWASPVGGLQTPMLAGRLEGTGPFGWLGDGATLAAHIKETLVRLKAQKLADADMDALTTYLETAKTYLATPVRTPLEERGKEVFLSDAAGCTTCHLDAGRKGDGSRRDVGTGIALDTPSLRFIGGTPPYMHDGRYTTLREVLVRTDGKMGHTAHLGEADVQALVAYLKTL